MASSSEPHRGRDFVRRTIIRTKRMVANNGNLHILVFPNVRLKV